MKAQSKWIVGLLLALILVVPAFFALLIWRDFHASRIRQEGEAVSAIANSISASCR